MPLLCVVVGHHHPADAWCGEPPPWLTPSSTHAYAGGARVQSPGGALPGATRRGSGRWSFAAMTICPCVRVGNGPTWTSRM